MDVDFGRAVERCLARIRPGHVATCGSLARALGDVRAARAVAAWLLVHPDTPGGYRVVRADGRMLFPKAARAVEQEDIRVNQGRVRAAELDEPLESVGFLTALRDEQRRLRDRVTEQDVLRSVNRVAGVDAAYDGDEMFVAATCLDAKDLTPVEIVTDRRVAEFPYIPTYLAYRESPGIEAAVRRLKDRPDVVLIDGHGRLHPIRFGVACHVGVRLNLPTIGVAKHPLVGRVNARSGGTRGAFPITVQGNVDGYAWTPPGRARPIYVSVGHQTSLDRALTVVRGSTRDGYPEPLKLADRICREMKRNEKRQKGVTR